MTTLPRSGKAETLIKTALLSGELSDDFSLNGGPIVDIAFPCSLKSFDGLLEMAVQRFARTPAECGHEGIRCHRTIDVPEGEPVASRKIFASISRNNHPSSAVDADKHPGQLVRS